MVSIIGSTRPEEDWTSDCLPHRTAALSSLSSTPLWSAMDKAPWTKAGFLKIPRFFRVVGRLRRFFIGDRFQQDLDLSSHQQDVGTIQPIRSMWFVLWYSFL